MDTSSSGVTGGIKGANANEPAVESKVKLTAIGSTEKVIGMHTTKKSKDQYSHVKNATLQSDMVDVSVTKEDGTEIPITTTDACAVEVRMPKSDNKPWAATDKC